MKILLKGISHRDDLYHCIWRKEGMKTKYNHSRPKQVIDLEFHSILIKTTKQMVDIETKNQIQRLHNVGFRQVHAPHEAIL